MSRRPTLLLAAVMALAVIVAGCGSSDDGTDTVDVDVTITKDQLIAQGDRICKQGNTEIEEGFERYFEENNISENREPSDEQGVEIVETVLVPNLKTQAELIRGLGAPEGDEEQVEELLDSLDEAIATAEDDPEALFNEDTDPFGDVNEQAQEYGFSECGEG